jgi:conjugal transfer pilus assembly protein TraK
MTALPALQLVDASDGVAVEAILSIKEPTRIRIEGADHRCLRQHPLEPCGLAAALPTSPA